MWRVGKKLNTGLMQEEKTAWVLGEKATQKNGQRNHSNHALKRLEGVGKV